MSDVILVVLDRPEAATHLLHAAERLAVLAGGARVNALAIRTPPGYVALTSEANMSGGLLEALAADEEQRIATLEAAFTIGRPDSRKRLSRRGGLRWKASPTR